MADEIQQAFRDPAVMVSFGQRLRNQFDINRALRRGKELEWLEDLRQHKGIYGPDVKIEANNSKVYPKITRSKVNIVLSRLHDLLFPDSREPNWEIDPTPEPHIKKEIATQIALSLVKPDEQGVPKIPTVEELQLAVKKFAKETCAKMANVIDDQLTETKYPVEVAKPVLKSGLQFGTGVAKGPLVNKRKVGKFREVNGEYERQEYEEEMPFFEFVRLWDWYPDMSVADLEKMEGSFQRHVMTKHDLRQLAKREDFIAEMINLHLTENPSGDYVPESWETDLQQIEIEASQQTTATLFASSTTEDKRSIYQQMGKKYEVLEFWGYVDGSDLQACGATVDDVSLEYGANVWVLGKKPIKAVLFDAALKQYKVFYFEKDETSIFGDGLPRVMRHSQAAIAAASRMVLDNGACVAGPNVEVNIDMLDDMSVKDAASFYPRKIWFRGGRGIEGQYPAVRDIQFDSHIPDLLSIIEAFKQFGDEETTLPTWMIGQMQNNETAQATSGRLSMVNISIKDIVKNFDCFTEGVIGDLYAWNMEFNPRQDIKGDFKVKAKGVSSLVMKEIRMQAMTQLKATMQPEDWDYVPRRDFLHEIFKDHDIRIELLTEAEVQQLRDQRQQGMEMQLAIAMQQSEIQKNKAQSMSLLTKAKNANVEAIQKAQAVPENQNPDLSAEEVALAQTERAGKEAEIRRQEEQHALKMAHEDESHRTKMASTTMKTAQGLAIKDKVTDHGMKLKEKAATIKARQVKAAPKPKKAVKAAK